MAYQLWDGFDDYDNSHELWDVTNGISNSNYSSAYARFAAAPNCVAQGLRIVASGQWKQKNLSSTQPRMLFSYPIYFEGFGPGGYHTFHDMLDNGSVQCRVAIGSDGSFALLNSSNTVLVSSAPGVVTLNRWYFLDIDVTISPSAGAFSLWLSTVLGGSALITATGLNTRSTANSYMTQFKIGDMQSGNFQGRFDDFHAMDPTGSAPNSILGEGSRIYTKVPTGAGYATALTPNGAAANWQCVDECPPDDDTTYVSAATFPLTDGYAIGAAGFTGTVNGVVRRSRNRKDDASAHTVQLGVRSSGVNSLATAVGVPSSYGWTDAYFANDPNTSAAWLAAAADAATPVLSAAS